MKKCHTKKTFCFVTLLIHRHFLHMEVCYPKNLSLEPNLMFIFSLLGADVCVGRSDIKCQNLAAAL